MSHFLKRDEQGEGLTLPQGETAHHRNNHLETKQRLVWKVRQTERTISACLHQCRTVQPPKQASLKTNETMSYPWAANNTQSDDRLFINTHTQQYWKSIWRASYLWISDNSYFSKLHITLHSITLQKKKKEEANRDDQEQWLDSLFEMLTAYISKILLTRK